MTDRSDECLSQLIGLRAHARFADRMSDAEPLERCRCVREDRIDPHAQFVGPFFRLTSEIDGNDSEFAILRRYRAHQPDFAAGGLHRGPCGGVAAARGSLTTSPSTCSGTITP